MKCIIAETRFDCVDRHGNEFVAHLMMGDVAERMCLPPREGIRESKLQISLEPLFPERGMSGCDSFNALCLAIEYIRKALRAFFAHGGMVYYHETRTPIDINHPLFEPIYEPIDERFLAGPSASYSRIDDTQLPPNAG